MAKAKEISGLDCEGNVLDWADEVLRVRFGEVIEKCGAVLESENIEGVHDMRVSIRRLRSAMRDFSSLMKTKPLGKIKKELKRIADALGAVRDEDVAILALEKLRRKSKEKIIKDGIGGLIDRRKEKREKAKNDLTETLSATALEDLQKRFDKAVEEAVKSSKTGKTISFNQAGRKVVGQSVEEFCALTDHIYEPFIDKPLHELRIAAKRLRYAIELYTACWGKKIEPFAEGIAQMQDFLGEIHDADLWLESLSKNLKDGKNENPANIRLLSEFVRKRTKNYRAALSLWNEWKTGNFIEKLKSTVAGTP